MEHIFNQLPVIYVYWACLLVVWSIINSGMMCKIILNAHHNHTYTRQSNVLILGTTIVGGIMLAGSVFVVPQVTVLFVEIALILSLWYTVFLATISHLNIDALSRRP